VNQSANQTLHLCEDWLLEAGRVSGDILYKQNAVRAQLHLSA